MKIKCDGGPATWTYHQDGLEARMQEFVQRKTLENESSGKKNSVLWYHINGSGKERIKSTSVNTFHE